MDIHGFCSPAFETVRAAFASNFERGLERGAAVAVTRDGAFEVDLWAGAARDDGTPWREDTIVNVYSTTKMMAASCMLLLAARGEISFDEKVARYWPEFAQNGKADILLRHVMSHSAGLAGFDPPLTNVEALYDWDAICARLAAQAPWWKPGTQSGYHAMTQGFLQGEVLRRVCVESLGAFFAREIAGPLGADFHIGTPAAHDARVAELVPPARSLGAAPGLTDIARRTFESCRLDGSEPRTSAWRRAELPAAGGIGNARAVARVLSALACEGEAFGVRLMNAAAVARIFEEQTNGMDLVMCAPLRFGMGFGLNHASAPISPSARAFFWGGWGGSLALVDCDQRLVIAYTMNRMESNLLGDTRGSSLVTAMYEALAG